MTATNPFVENLFTAAKQMLRPLQLLQDTGNLVALIPDIDSRRDLKKFLIDVLRSNDSDEQRRKREMAREELVNTIQCDKDTYNRDVKMVVFDVDHTKALLYPISSMTGAWALERLVELHHNEITERYLYEVLEATQKFEVQESQIKAIAAQNIYMAARTVQPEFLCHSPHDFMRELARITGLQNTLDPESPVNAPIMNDWRDATEVLNKQFVFKEVQSGVRAIKDSGGLVYVATNGPPANVFHRLHIWFGAEGASLFDGIAVRATLPGMSDVNRFASAEEIQFVDTLKRDNKVIIVPEEHIKPNGHHLKYVLDHANEGLRKAGAQEIQPENMVLVGDSLSSDGGAAQGLADLTSGRKSQFAYIAHGVVVNPDVMRAHQLVGHAIDRLGVEPVLERLKKDYPKPQAALRKFGEFFQYFNIVSPYSPQPRTDHVRRPEHGLTDFIPKLA